MLNRAFWLQFSTPKTFYPVAGKMIPVFMVLAVLSGVIGLYLSFFETPRVAGLQKEAYHIIFVHVAASWMSMFIYMIMGGYAMLGFILKARLSGMMASALAPTGAMMTFIALITGIIWGRAAWNPNFTWTPDPRLMTELVLFFLYMGFILLQVVIDDARRAMRAGAILAIVGVVFLPLIFFAVKLPTIHQPANIRPGHTMPVVSVVAMLVMVFSFWMYSIAASLMRVRAIMLEQEKRTAWVQQLLGAKT